MLRIETKVKEREKVTQSTVMIMENVATRVWSCFGGVDRRCSGGNGKGRDRLPCRLSLDKLRAVRE